MPPPKKIFLYYPLSSVFTYAKKSLEKFYERDKHFAYFMEKTIALFYIPLHWYLKVCWSYIWCFARFGTISAFEIQVLRKSAIKCRGNFRTLQFASGMRRQKKLPKTQHKPLYITLEMASAYLGILPRAMIWSFNSWDYLFYLYSIVYL